MFLYWQAEKHAAVERTSTVLGVEFGPRALRTQEWLHVFSSLSLKEVIDHPDERILYPHRRRVIDLAQCRGVSAQ